MKILKKGRIIDNVKTPTDKKDKKEEGRECATNKTRKGRYRRRKNNKRINMEKEIQKKKKKIVTSRIVEEKD